MVIFFFIMTNNFGIVKQISGKYFKLKDKIRSKLVTSVLLTILQRNDGKVDQVDTIIFNSTN